MEFDITSMVFEDYLRRRIEYHANRAAESDDQMVILMNEARVESYSHALEIYRIKKLLPPSKEREF